MSTQDREFQQTAQRWMQGDPMYSGEGERPAQPQPFPTALDEKSSWFQGDVSILSGGLGLFGIASCLVLTVEEWWVPFFVGTAAALVAIYGIVRSQANRKGWIATGLILGAISIAFGFAAKVSWDDQKCVVEADSWEELEACDA